MDFNFGTKGVKAVASVPGVDINRNDPNVTNWVVGGTEIPVKVATKGFAKGPLTVWIQSSGDAAGTGWTPWRKYTVTPDDNGVVTVWLKPKKVEHCSAVWIRVNDKEGNWTEEDFSLMVQRPCPNCTPAE